MVPRAYMLQPATLRPIHVYRPRIMQHLHRCLGQAPVTLINAPAGYGKSLAIAEFLTTSGLKAAFVPGARLEHRPPICVIATIAAAIRKHEPGFFPDAKPLASADAAELSTYAPSRVFEQLLDAIDAFSRQLLVVIEDYHDLTEEASPWVERLISEAPGNLKLIVSSRFRPSWSHKWFADGLIAQLTREQLVFQSDECLTLAHQLGIELSPADALATFHYAGGWPMFYGLAFQHIKLAQNADILAELRKLNRPEQEVFECIARAILRSLPQEEQDLLRKTAALTYIDEELCIQAFGIPRAEALLAKFEHYGLLTCVSVQTRPRYVHSHALIREFLAHELRLNANSDEQQLYERAGEVYEQRAELEEALRVYCQFGNVQRAVHLIADHGLNLVLTGDVRQLNTWLGILPEGQIAADPTLLVYQGIVQIEFNRNLAELPLRQALSLFQAAENLPAITWVTAELLWMYYLQGNNVETVKLVPYLLEHRKTVDPLREARVLFMIGMSHFGIDSFDMAEVYIKEAIDLYRSLASLEGQKAIPRMLRFLGNSYLIRGFFHQAFAAFEEAYQLASKLKLSPDVLWWIKFQQAVAYHNTGRFEEALVALDEVERQITSALPNYNQNEQYRWVLIRRGHIYRDNDDPERAQSSYQEYFALSSAGRDGIEMAFDLTRRDRCDKAFPAAQELYRQSLDWQSPADKAKFEATLGIAYLGVAEQSNPPNETHLMAAKKHLEAAIPVIEHFTSSYCLATYRFYLASTYLHCSDGNPSYAADKCLEYTLSTLQRNSCYNLDVWQSWTVGRLCAYAISRHIEADFAVDLAIRRLSLTDSEPFLPLLAHQDQAVRGRAAQVLQAIGRDLLVDTLGLLEHCKIEQIKRRLKAALLSLFLTDTGLLRLHHQYRLTWREIDILMFWITPRFRTSTAAISNEIYLTAATIQENLEAIWTKLQLAPADEDPEPQSATKRGRPERRGLVLKAYVKLSKEGIINENAPNPLDQPSVS
jgi:tetratricopeptide (TPR) repeat protein